MSRPGKVTTCPKNTIFIDKGAKEGEAHCLNIYANGSFAYFPEISFANTFCISVLTKKNMFSD